jgi:hypothetical protein
VTTAADAVAVPFTRTVTPFAVSVPFPSKAAEAVVVVFAMAKLVSAETPPALNAGCTAWAMAEAE